MALTRRRFIDLLIGGLFIHNVHTGDTPKTIIARILKAIDLAILSMRISATVGSTPKPIRCTGPSTDDL